MKLSKNFSDDEFACPCCGEVKIENRLISKLQILRDLCGVPIYILSGYRCESRNKEIGGSPSSLHLYGFAADIYVVNMGYTQLLENVLALNIFNGVGINSNEDFLHLDIGSTNRIYLNRGGEKVNPNSFLKKLKIL